MKTLSIDNKKYNLRTSYKEMNRKTFFMICTLYTKFLTKATIEEYNALRIQAFFILIGTRYRITTKIVSSEWVDILPYIDYVFEDAPNLDKNLIPVLKVGRFRRKKLFGPQGMLDNVSIYEMMEADTAFVQASNFQNIEKVYLLASILYRPQREDLAEFKRSVRWNKDVREPYNFATANERIKLMKKVPFYKIVAIFLYYWSFREGQLIKNPIFAPLFEGKDTNMGLDIGWLGTLLQVSNSTFGTLDQTKEQNWKLVLVKIANDMVIHENREAKRKEDAIRAGFNQ